MPVGGGRIQPHHDVVYRDLHDLLGQDQGGVLLHLESGQYHGLNATGSMIWRLLDGRRSLQDIVAELRQSLEEAPPDLEAIVASFVDALRERDLVR